MALDYPEQHRREALIGTVVIHVALVLFCLFTVFKGPTRRSTRLPRPAAAVWNLTMALTPPVVAMYKPRLRLMLRLTARIVVRPPLLPSPGP